jgi:hypothetical protein
MLLVILYALKFAHYTHKVQSLIPKYIRFSID